MADTNITDENSVFGQALPAGAELADGQYTISGHLGAGGFGITYRALDNVLGRTIVIKECFPEDFCMREGTSVLARSNSYAKPVRSIVEMFMREARSLARLRHPNIVGVHGAFEENDTAYMVLDLIDGPDLLDILQANPTPFAPARVRRILGQLLEAIEKVHEIDLLHRDISPDNIIIEKSGAPVLIDFGAARADASRKTRAKSQLLVVKDGYSPQEFYVAGSQQYPCSDLYALAATFYHLLSGSAPPDSQARLMEIASQRPDPCVPLAGRIAGYDPEFLQAIDQAMALHPKDRLQSAGDWRERVGSIPEAEDGGEASDPSASQIIDPEFERSLSRLVEETNVEVRKSQLIRVEPQRAPPPPPKKSRTVRPEWADEFNEESRALALRKVPGAGAVPVIAQGARPPATGLTVENWIVRAMEKQERIRAERQREFERLLAQEREDAGEDAPRRAQLPLETKARAGGDRPPPRMLSIVVVAGGLVFLCSVAFLQAI